MSSNILVVAEHVNGTIDDITFELLGKGRELADDGGLAVALLGGGSDLAGQLGKADRVLHVDHPALADFNPQTCAAALGAVIEQARPTLVLVGNTSVGMDLAVAAAVQNKLPLVAYATDIVIENGKTVATSQLYGGKVYAESVIDKDAGIVSVLAGSFPTDAGRSDGTPEVVAVTAPDGLDGGTVTFKGLIKPEGGDVDITQHEVLVAVGRGIQNKDNIPLTEELATALGGVVCSSRPIVDNKWLPKTRQVGKSGLKVKPKIYVMLGISGAPEHMEGMKDAELIIAVNTDETAPIFEHAHYGTTEDIFDLVPALTERLQ
ncbi:MAG: electron transfer flavoprotein subunit alpha [Planctomycetes bacterium]|jgi:electron transfer flavoprotein alpha subunit|nr:electron transfer flavoprotein subunit alpha [Planctomycetota bacterium]